MSPPVSPPSQGCLALALKSQWSVVIQGGDLLRGWGGAQNRTLVADLSCAVASGSQTHFDQKVPYATLET